MYTSLEFTDQDTTRSINAEIKGYPYTHGRYIPMQCFSPKREGNPRVFRARRKAGKLQFWLGGCDGHGWIDAPPKFTFFYA